MRPWARVASAVAVAVVARHLLPTQTLTLKSSAYNEILEAYVTDRLLFHEVTVWVDDPGMIPVFAINTWHVRPTKVVVVP